MIRLFKYDACSQFTDFPNDLFRRKDISVTYFFDEDKVTIDETGYRLSTALHIQRSGSPAYSVETSLYIKLKSKLKVAFQNLFTC